MGKMPGRKGERGLADMSAEVSELEYRPPPKTACDERQWPQYLTEVDRLHIRTWRYRGRIVDFAIMQIIEVDGKDVHVARIDCCHSIIHRHQFDKAGVDLYDHRVIVPIPHEDGWDVVDAGYAAATDVMFNEWEENLRRWKA